MSFRDHLRKIMITYPSLFTAPVCVYDHIFLAAGNGYSWKDGELVYDDEYSLCNTTEESIEKIKNYYFELVKEIHVNHSRVDDTFNNIVDRYIKESTKYIHNILNIEDILDDLSIPDMCEYSLNEVRKSEFKFCELSKYSAIANIPDDVRYEWIKAIKDFVDILDKNTEKFLDSENLFEDIKTRVNIIFKKRIEEYLNELPW